MTATWGAWPGPVPTTRAVLCLGLVLGCWLPVPGVAEEPEQAAGAGSPGPTPAVDTSGWDWGEIEAEDAAPVRPTRSSAGHPGVATTHPRVGSTAAPDFDGEVREGYRIFAKAPPFSVIPSQKDPDMHPCVDCHDWAESDRNPRELQEPHDNFRLEHGLHGKGQFWCFTCHHLEGNGGLRTLEGLKLSFDEAYIVCSQCHARAARDWVFGAHGKRVGSWRGERRLYNCTVCHYQHRPPTEARAPRPAPRVRAGLRRPTAHVSRPVPIWERYARRRESVSGR